MQTLRRGGACRASAPATAPSLGLVLPLGDAGAWDASGIHNPVVRVYQGDNEERWFMWYTGRDAPEAPNGALFPAAGRIGTPPPPNPTALPTALLLLDQSSSHPYTCPWLRSCDARASASLPLGG